MKIGILTFHSQLNYGDGLVRGLARKLTAEFGAGYTASNLFNMRQFYLAFPKFYTLCRELDWSKYRILMRIENADARQYYMEECAKSGWSVRILQRQIASLYYERLLRHKANPKSLRALIKREAPQAQIGELFGKDQSTIARHINSK